MKRQNTGHRWTDEELKILMAEWDKEQTVDSIAEALNVTRSAILKMVLKLRSNGIPLKRRTNGHVAGRRNQPWTQEEIEYLVRRREQQATTETISVELSRSWNAIQNMIGVLRKADIPVKMLGCGVRRLWSPQKLKESAIGRRLIDHGEDTDQHQILDIT